VTGQVNHNCYFFLKRMNVDKKWEKQEHSQPIQDSVTE